MKPSAGGGAVAALASANRREGTGVAGTGAQRRSRSVFPLLLLLHSPFSDAFVVSTLALKGLDNNARPGAAPASKRFTGTHKAMVMTSPSRRHGRVGEAAAFRFCRPASSCPHYYQYDAGAATPTTTRISGVAAGAGIEDHESKVASGQQGLLTRVTPERVLRRMFGKSGGASRKPSGDRGLSLARLACRALLPSVALGGFASAAAGAGGAAASLSPLLTNRWYVWAILMASSSAGLWSERTRWGAAVSSPLVTMLLTITLCNVGVLPASSPAYDTVNQIFVPLAVPLLLFDADLQKVLRFAGTLLACFVVGAAGTVIGTAAAAAAVPLGLGSDGWKIASALAARHIGGAVNYVAVCETLGVSADAVVAGLAADNMVVSLYFVFLFWVTKPEKREETTTGAGAPAERSTDASTEVEAALAPTATSPPPLGVTKESISYALTAACVLCLCGELLSKVAFGGRVSSIPLVTLATVAGATVAPSIVGRLGNVGAQLGVLLMQLFFAVTGAQGSLAVVMGTAPSLLVFSIVQIAVHFGVLVGVGRLFRLPFRELALASNANVGGPTTAAAMAAAKGWKNLVLPALLTGVLGYATATFIGVGIGHAFLKALVKGATI
eukprot:g8463.t1